MSLFQFSNYFLLRTPLLPSRLATDLLEQSNINDIEVELRRLYCDERLKEALFLASPAFFMEVEKWLNYKKDANHKMLISLLKYTIRMSTRSTPFGLFAGVSLGNFTSTEQAVSLRRNKIDKLVLKLDAPVVVEIIEKLSRDPLIYNEIDYRINPSLYLENKYYKYYQKIVSEKKSQHILKSVRSTPILDRVIQYFDRNKQTAHYASLIELLENLGASTDQSIQFVNNLVKEGIISSELQPNVIGSGYLDCLTRTLQRVDKQDRYLPTLLTIKTLLESSKSVFQIQDEVVKLLQPLVPELNLSRSVQSDLLIGMAESSISNTALTHIKDQFQDLLALSNQAPLIDFDLFKTKFIQKYEDRMISLMTALDPDIGIGYGSQEGTYNVSDEILRDVKNMDSSIKVTNGSHHYQNHVIEKFVGSVKNQFSEIQLTNQDLIEISKQHKQPPNDLPISFYALGNLLRRSPQEKLFFNLGAIGGSSSGNLISRFAHLDEKLNSKLEESAQEEQQQMAHAVLAEICHYPDNNAGNIVHRPALRKASIYLSAAADQDQDQEQIDINDLYLFAKDQHLVLWSKKLNKIIIPRLTTAHNFEKGMNIYKFLADFQFQSNRLDLSWNWGILKEQPRLPRVSYKNIILARAQWRIQKIQKYPNEPHEYIKNLKTRLEIPTWIVLSSGDNELLINLDNPLCIELLMDHIYKRDTLLTEYILNEFSSVVIDKDDTIFANEIIIPILSQTVAKAQEIAPQESTLKRYFSLGSEWLYAKIYCGLHVADRLLKEVIPLIIATIDQQGQLKKWFFIRYNDPAPHIRFRVELSDPKQSSTVINIIHNILEPFVEAGQVSNISFDTYIREIERYTPYCMELSEELFYRQSDAIVRVIQQNESINDRWRFAFEYIESLLDAAEFTLIEKKEFCLLMNKLYQQEFGNNKKLWVHLNNKFKEKRDWFDTPLDPLPSAEKIKLLNLQQHIFSTVRTHEDQGQRPTVQTSLLASYIHMFINRLFMSDQRLYELSVYHFMAGYYKMQSGKQKAFSHQQA